MSLDASPRSSALTRLTAPVRRHLRPGRVVGAAALLLVTIGAGSGAAYAFPQDGRAATPTDPNTRVAAGLPLTGAVNGANPTGAPAVDRTARPAPARAAVWPQLTWYSQQEYGGEQNAPARIWRGTPGGTWQVVREGRPGDRTSVGRVIPAPDGNRAAWMEAHPKRLVISPFEGGASRSVPVQGEETCTPGWLDLGRVVFGEGRPGDLTIVAVNADGTGRRVLATHQPQCPVVGPSAIGQFTGRTVTISDEGDWKRTVTPRIPARLTIHALSAISPDTRSVVISTHVPNVGECGCTWRIRNYRVDVGTGAAVELAPLDPAWRKATGHGMVEGAVFLRDGQLVAQVNAATSADDAPSYRLVRYAPNGRVLASAPVPAGNPWGSLLG